MLHLSSHPYLARDIGGLHSAGTVPDHEAVGGSGLDISLPHMDIVLSISGPPGAERLVRAIDATLRTDGGDSVLDDAIHLARLVHGLRRRDLEDPDEAVAALPKWRLRRVFAHVEANIASPIRLADLAVAAGLSRMYFAAQFRAATGIRPHDYVLRRRIDHASRLLGETLEPISQIALGVGFQTQAHFTSVFKRFTGETPRRWRARHSRLA